MTTPVYYVLKGRVGETPNGFMGNPLAVYGFSLSREPQTS